MSLCLCLLSFWVIPSFFLFHMLLPSKIFIEYPPLLCTPSPFFSPKVRHLSDGFRGGGGHHALALRPHVPQGTHRYNTNTNTNTTTYSLSIQSVNAAYQQSSQHIPDFPCHNLIYPPTTRPSDCGSPTHTCMHAPD